MAVKVWLPFAAVVVFQEIEYGEVVSWAPRFAPSSWNCTPATPTLSDALAATVTLPDTLAPFAGAVMDTVGGVVSDELFETVTITDADVVRLPELSRAMA